VQILQVLGSLKDYREVEYVIEGRGCKTLLSSIALKEWFEEAGEKAEIHLLVPESLVERIEGNPLELLQDHEKFRRKISERIGRDAEIHIIPSVGEYSEIIFEGSVENIIVSIFKKLVEDGSDAVIGDVSTGQNIYAISMLEALRRYIVYRKLERIIHDGGDLNFKLVFTPPVMKGIERIAVEFYNLDVKAFFSLPKADVYRICKPAVMEINEKYSELLKRLNKCINALKIGFNAISMNVPLAFYHPEVLDLDFDVEEMKAKLLELLDDALTPEIQQNGGLRVRRRMLDSNNVANIFYSLGLMKSIKKFAESLTEPELSAIFEHFSALYSKLGLGSNTRFLQRDISSIRDRVPDGFSEVYIKCFQDDGEEHKSGDRKRNFFAHSGFLREATFIERTGDKVTVRWVERYFNEIGRWLENPY